MGKPVVLVVMDGVGWTDKDNGNAVMHAYKPQIDELMTKWPHTTIKASGTAVGLPSDDDMGNSEVGHNALGCGQIYSQGAKLVNESINPVISTRQPLGEVQLTMQRNMMENSTS